MNAEPKEKSLIAAKHMIARYGEGVLQEVELRISELEESGHAEAHELWIDIRDAVVELMQ